MLPSSTLFLGKVAYVPQKRQIVAEFSNSSQKISKRYSFFPKLFFPLRGISQESLREALSEHDLKRVKVDFEGTTAVVFAATFSDLKKANNLLAEFFGFRSNLVEPQRQFLIEKGWSYFEPFRLDGVEIVKLNSMEFPEMPADFLSGSLSENAAELLRSNRALAQDLISRIASSRLLKIPMIGAEQEFSAEEIFLENVFFASSEPLSFGPKSARHHKGHFSGDAELDFSRIVSIIASQPFNNIGFESMNCDCCRPLSLSEKNVLPSSLVRVRFLNEGFYFNSASPAWALHYHRSHQLKDAREARRSEYFYSFYPVGPFSREEEADILLSDAVALENAASAKIVGDSKAEWFCLKTESRLSAEINSLRLLLEQLCVLAESEQISTVASQGLFFARSMESSPSFFYRKALAATASSVLSSLPLILTDSGARFFRSQAAIALECIRFSILKELDSLVSSSGSFAKVPANSNSILVEHSAVLGISKRFSELYCLGKPFIQLKAGI